MRLESVAGAMRSPRGRDPANVTWIERTVYAGRVLNQPHGLSTVKAGDLVQLVDAPGLPHPLAITSAYRRERETWAFAPCDKCGADQALDPPSVMARTRFPGMPAGSMPIAFTAFCPCGGTMMLAAIEGAATPPSAASEDEPPPKPWWRFW